MLKDNLITVGLRKEYDRLVAKHGLTGLIPVYEHGGVFVFDYKLDNSRLSGAEDLSTLGEKSKNPKVDIGPLSQGGASSSSRTEAPWSTVAAGKKSTPMKQAVQKPGFQRQPKA